MPLSNQSISHTTTNDATTTLCSVEVVSSKITSSTSTTPPTCGQANDLDNGQLCHTSERGVNNVANNSLVSGVSGMSQQHPQTMKSCEISTPPPPSQQQLHHNGMCTPPSVHMTTPPPQTPSSVHMTTPHNQHLIHGHQITPHQHHHHQHQHHQQHALHLTTPPQNLHIDTSTDHMTSPNGLPVINDIVSSGSHLSAPTNTHSSLQFTNGNTATSATLNQSNSECTSVPMEVGQVVISHTNRQTTNSQTQYSNQSGLHCGHSISNQL